MSKFGTVLKRIMSHQRLTGAALAASSGIDPATISRLLRGDQASPSMEHLEKIIYCASDRQIDRGELARAYVLDLLPEIAADTLDIELRGSPRPRALREDYLTPIPDDLKEALLILRKGAEDDLQLKEMLLYVAELYKSHIDPK